jgi:hypothetical protein
VVLIGQPQLKRQFFEFVLTPSYLRFHLCDSFVFFAQISFIFAANFLHTVGLLYQCRKLLR